MEKTFSRKILIAAALLVATAILVAIASKDRSTHGENATAAVTSAQAEVGRETRAHVENPGSTTAQPKKPEAPVDLKALSLDLEPKAVAGDPAAQVGIARIFSDCLAYSVNPAGFVGEGREPASTPATFNRAAYQSVFDDHVSRCRGFGPREIKVSRIGELYAQAAKNGNPVAIAHQLSRTVQSSEETKAAVAEVLRSRDPYAVDELADAMGLKADGRADAFGELSGTELYGYAWKLVACDLGLPCGPDSDAARSYCLSMYICGRGDVESIYRDALLSQVDFFAVQQRRAEIALLLILAAKAAGDRTTSRTGASAKHDGTRRVGCPVCLRTCRHRNFLSPLHQ